MSTRAPRLPDWMGRLDALVRARQQVTYAWGVHDCCTFGADAIEAVTGVDRMADLRGRYRTQGGAYRLLAKLGGLEAVLVDRLGPPVAATLAQVGDVGISGTALVVFGGGVWLGQAEQGLVPVPPPALAWRCTGV